MTCFVYVIGFDLEKGPSKVGIAANPTKRMASLQTGHFQRLFLAGTWGCPDREIARELEAAFHATQRDTRISGEWFDLAPKKCMAILHIGLGVLLNLRGKFSPPEVDEILAISEGCSQ